MTPTRFMCASAAAAFCLLAQPQPSHAECDIAACNPKVCDPWRPDWTINDFPAHQTDTTQAQRQRVGEIARIVADSRDDPDPIICLRLIGHASSFRNISADEYDRRAEARGETIAEMLTDTLATHGLTSFSVNRADIDNDDAFCGEVLGSEVTLIFDGRGNACPLVDNMVNSSSSAARANRAINRRVSIYALRDAAPIDSVEVKPAQVCESFPSALCAVIPDPAIEGLICAGSWSGLLASGMTRADLSERIRAGTARHFCGPLASVRDAD